MSDGHAPASSEAAASTIREASTGATLGCVWVVPPTAGASLCVAEQPKHVAKTIATTVRTTR